MTELSEKPDGKRRGRTKPPATADDELEQLALSFASPVVDLAQNLSAGLMNALQTLLRHAYLKGRRDMLTEIAPCRCRGGVPPVGRKATMASMAAQAAVARR